jgi:hypothetical protein
MRIPASRSALTSYVALLVATALASVVFLADRRGGRNVSQSTDETSQVAAEVAVALPDDPRLTERLASRWANVARAVARAEGADGLRTLDLFGADAADIFSRNPHTFRDLSAIVRLDSPLREASAGPWREAVLQWARAGRLGPYCDHLARLDIDQRKLLAETPGCLPLLGRGATTAEAMLSRHGARAWRLFLVVDFAEGVTGVERVAGALETYGDRMLRVNESYGPALAFMFVPPGEDASGHLPRLFAEAIDRLGLEDAGALFLANYDDLARLVLMDGHTPEEVVEAIDLLAGQTEEVRVLAPDSGRVLRLLLERRGREPIGAEILARCGPEAADVLFEDGGYAGHPQGKEAALAILSRRGWPGLELLRTFRDDESWNRLIRRADLMDRDDEPLIVRLAGKLERSPGRQDEIERYLGMPRDQIVGLDIPPTFVDIALDWVPGYVAAHTAYNAARGYRVETSEIALALLDGVTTVSFVGKLAGQAMKTVGSQVAKAEVQAATREVAREASLRFAASEGRQGAKTLLTRLPGALASLTRSLPKRLPTLDVTSIVRSSSGVAKKVGVRTWGKLDRRIIMRGDRMVVIDLFDPKVVSLIEEEVRNTAIKELRDAVIRAIEWEVVSKEVGELGPCVMERVHPGMRSEPEESPPPLTHAPTSPVADSVTSGGISPEPPNHPALTTIGSALIIACLALSIPRVRRLLGRRFVSGQKGSARKPRRYEE